MHLYASDHIQTWIYCCIEEKYDSLSPDEATEYLLYITEDTANLKSECKELLEASGLDTNSMLGDAIINTIDMPDLFQNLKDNYETELADANE